MAANASITLLGIINGLAGGTKYIQPTMITSGTPVATVQTGLTSGANVLAVPTGAVSVLIVPPAGNVQTISIGGVALHKTNWTFLSLDASQTMLPITAGAAIAGCEVWWI